MCPKFVIKKVPYIPQNNHIIVRLDQHSIFLVGCPSIIRNKQITKASQLLYVCIIFVVLMNKPSCFSDCRRAGTSIIWVSSVLTAELSIKYGVVLADVAKIGCSMWIYSLSCLQGRRLHAIFSVRYQLIEYSTQEYITMQYCS